MTVCRDASKSFEVCIGESRFNQQEVRLALATDAGRISGTPGWK